MQARDPRALPARRLCASLGHPRVSVAGTASRARPARRRGSGRLLPLRGRGRLWPGSLGLGPGPPACPPLVRGAARGGLQGARLARAAGRWGRSGGRAGRPGRSGEGYPLRPPRAARGVRAPRGRAGSAPAPARARPTDGARLKVAGGERVWNSLQGPSLPRSDSPFPQSPVGVAALGGSPQLPSTFLRGTAVRPGRSPSPRVAPADGLCAPRRPSGPCAQTFPPRGAPEPCSP